MRTAKRWLFTSPIRHWKNGEKDMAFKIWFINIVSSVVAMIVAFKVQKKHLEAQGCK